MEKHIVEEIVAKSVFFFLWQNAVEISAEDKTLCSCCNPMIIDPKQNLPTLFYYIIINGSLSLFFFFRIFRSSFPPSIASPGSSSVVERFCQRFWGSMIDTKLKKNYLLLLLLKKAKALLKRNSPRKLDGCNSVIVHVWMDDLCHLLIY